MPADGDPPSPNSLELERADHQRLIREFVWHPVMGLDFAEADDLERRLLLVRLEVDRAVDHVLERLERLVRVHASLQRDGGHHLRLPQAVHETLDEAHRFPLVRLGDRGTQRKIREPEVRMFLLELLIQLAYELVDVVEVRRAIDAPDVLLLHRLPGRHRRGAVDPAHQAELVVFDERRQDRSDVFRNVDGQFGRRDDDDGDAFLQAFRDEVQEGDLLPDERGAHEQDVGVERNAPVEQVVEAWGAGLHPVRLLLDGDGLLGLRLAGGCRDAGLHRAFPPLHLLLLLVGAPLEILFSVPQAAFPFLELRLAAHVLHSRRPASLSRLVFQFEGFQLQVRLALLDLLRLLEEVAVLLVQTFDLRLEVRLHLVELPFPGIEIFFLPAGCPPPLPPGQFLHLCVLLQLGVLLRLFVELMLGILDRPGPTFDLGGPLPQGRLLIGDLLLPRDVLRLAVVEHPPLTLELLLGSGRILVPLLEPGLHRLEFHLLLPEFFLLREDLLLPFFQLANPGRIGSTARRLDLLPSQPEFRILQLQLLFLLQQRRTFRVERLLEFLEAGLAFLDRLDLRLGRTELGCELDRGPLDLLLAFRERSLPRVQRLTHLLVFRLQRRDVRVAEADLLGLRLDLRAGGGDLPIDVPQVLRAFLDRVLPRGDVREL